MIRFVVALVAGLLVWAWAPAGAQAQVFGDCADTAYVRQFDERLVGDGFGCTELDRLTVATEEGPRDIRVVQGFNADWAIDPAFPEQVRAGVRAFAEALPRLGGFRLEPVTVLLVDDLPPRHDYREGIGEEDEPAHASSAGDGECRVTVYPLVAMDDAFIRFALAHELFHCVQFATVREKMASSTNRGTAGGGWWIEGTADWFADLAVPGTGVLAGRASDFDADASSLPLHSRSYDAVVFFAWLGSARGPASVVPFLRAMAASAGEGSQEAAMRSALDSAGWKAFLATYLARDIRDSAGNVIVSPREDGPTWRFEDTRDERITARPFTIQRSTASLACGRWNLSVAPDGDVIGLDRPFGGGSWGDLPAEIDASTAGDGDRDIGAMRIGSGDGITLAAGKMSGCGDCAGLRETDACLVGTWRMTGGGMEEALRARFPVPGLTRMELTPPDITYRADGSFSTGTASAEIDVRQPDKDIDARGRVSASGRWSAAGGRLNTCTDVQNYTGRMDIRTPDRSGTVGVPGPPPGATGTMSMTYSCSRDMLTTTMDVPGIGPVESTFARASPAP